MSTLQGSGDGGFEPAQVHSAGEAVITCNTGHINEDSAVDVVCPGGAVPVVLVFDGQGDGSFAPPRRISLAEKS